VSIRKKVLLFPMPVHTYLTLLVVAYAGYWVNYPQTHGRNIWWFSFILPILFLLVVFVFIVLSFQIDRSFTNLVLQILVACLVIAPLLFFHPW
jgi:hypothetical protein